MICLPWARAFNNPYVYTNMHFINALKQRAVGEIVAYTRNRFPTVEAICVFGSAVTEYCTPHSDIDFVLYGNPTDAYRPHVDGEVLDYQWASTIPNNSKLRDEVLREGVVVYAKRDV